MKIIAHRGNLNGPCPEENTPKQIIRCVELGYDVEVDLWYDGSMYWLGHDAPAYEVPMNLLEHYSNHLWIHCKNDRCLLELANYPTLHYFWHEQDQYTLTSRRIIWAYPGSHCAANCVVLLPERTTARSEFSALLSRHKECYGICTDYPTCFT